MPAIETLGAATVLCVDKTGTLTMNHMSVQALFTGGQWLYIDSSLNELPGTFHEVVEYSILASSRDPFDSMEKAFADLGQRFLAAGDHLHPDWKLAREYPLSPELLAMSRAWHVAGSTRCYIAAKGAPEAVISLCGLSGDEKKRVEAASTEMASRGLRVLAVAKAVFTGEMPHHQKSFPFEFAGLVGLADPLRSSVPEAVRQCHGAGIRIIMITGDYPATARNIAAQAGLRNPDSVLTGPELAQLNDAELRQRAGFTNVFARVVPEQKLRIVNALKATGEIVAMTGDGVNDAPALKAADIGIAMGNRGTDVAREAAALVLLDDDFSSIVNAIRQGRRIYDNLKKATAFVLAAHVPIAGVTLVPLLLGWPLLLMPVHIVFLELIIDPACSVAFEAEPEERMVMSRPPRSLDERLFGKKRVLLALLQGFTVFAATFALYGAFLYLRYSEADARAAGFSALVMGNLALIFANRSGTRTMWETFTRKNRFLWTIVVGSISTLLLTFYVPALRAVFHFSSLHLAHLCISVLAGFLGVLGFEMLKLAIQRPSHPQMQRGQKP